MSDLASVLKTKLAVPQELLEVMRVRAAVILDEHMRIWVVVMQLWHRRK